MLPAQFFDNAFSNDMVGKAAKGLDADDIIDARMYQFQHFPGQKPAFPGLVAKGYNVLCIIRQLRNFSRRIKMYALFKCVARRAAQPFEKSDSQVCIPGRLLAFAEVFHLEILIIKSIQ